jgi:hypothetical protein
VANSLPSDLTSPAAGVTLVLGDAASCAKVVVVRRFMRADMRSTYPRGVRSRLRDSRRGDRGGGSILLARKTGTLSLTGRVDMAAKRGRGYECEAGVGPTRQGPARGQ